MSDEWDKDSDSEAVVPVTKKKSKWEDEEGESEENVKDDWDASDSEEQEDKPKTKPVSASLPPVRRKGITKQKIAEKEREQERLEMETAEMEDPVAKKRRELQQQIESDMDMASSLFGTAKIGSPSIPNDLLTQNPITKAQFESFSSSLSALIVEKHGSKPLYALFLENFFRSLSGPLKDVEVRKLASVLTAVANEKQAAAKKADGSKPKKKTVTKLAGNSKGAGVKDTSVYTEALGDGDYGDDDFM